MCVVYVPQTAVVYSADGGYRSRRTSQTEDATVCGVPQSEATADGGIPQSEAYRSRRRTADCGDDLLRRRRRTADGGVPQTVATTDGGIPQPAELTYSADGGNL